MVTERISSGGRNEPDVGTEFISSGNELIDNWLHELWDWKVTEIVKEASFVVNLVKGSGVVGGGLTDVSVADKDVTIENGKAVGGVGGSGDFSMTSHFEEGEGRLYVKEDVAKEGDEVRKNINSVDISKIFVGTRSSRKHVFESIHGRRSFERLEFNRLAFGGGLLDSGR